MKNILNREIPEFIKGYGNVINYPNNTSNIFKKNVSSKTISNEDKLNNSLDEVLDKLNLKDGMTFSFHHHLRNGDYVLNSVMENISKRGIKNITIVASAIFPVHSPLVKYIKDKTITRIYAGYISGDVAEAISNGQLENPAVMHSHGGRARIIESGNVTIDVAFIAAPSSDEYGNINGIKGPSACGALGYAHADAMYANKTVVLTDNLVNYPNTPIEINQTYIDFVVKVDSLGDPNGIVSGTTQITKNPIGLKVAKLASQVIEHSGLLKNGISFQTGAGGISLAVAAEVKKLMEENKIQGSFASGGITGYIVDMYEKGLFKSLFDVQCFDLKAIKSCAENPEHLTMSASMYANAWNKGAVVNKLDVVILGATEIDTDFNVNVLTTSDGKIMGGSGGHADTAAGAKLTIIVTQLANSRLSVIKDRVAAITTPGNSVDVLVTERGIAINPLRTDLLSSLKNSNLPILTIEELKNIAESLTGKPNPLKFGDKIVAIVEYRDGSVIDIVKNIID